MKPFPGFPTRLPQMDDPEELNVLLYFFWLLGTINLLQATGSTVHLQVDGGINAQTAPQAVRQGADVLVAAQAIFGHPQGVAAGVRALRESLQPALA